MGQKKEDIKATSTESYKSVKRGYPKVLNFPRFFVASSDKLSETLTFIPTADENGMKDDLFKRKLDKPYESFQTI